MPFLTFELERWQSDWEHTVDFNLADSSVSGALISEIVSDDEWRQISSLELGYPQVNGTEHLRQLIAALHPPSSANNVLVTVGGAEANQLVVQTLLEPGDHVVIMEPGYRQLYGIAKTAGCRIDPLPLIDRLGWRPDLDQLEKIVTRNTKAISIVNPNNPTGAILRPDEMDRIVSIASRAGAWLLSDEVYRGSERYTDEETPTFWGRYERVVVVNSLSKAYGLQGLRIGWIVGPASTIADFWRRHEYAVISAAGPSMKLAEHALTEPKRRQLLDRQRRMARSGWALVDQWIGANDGLFSVERAEATSIAFVRYDVPIDSVRLADEIRVRGSVLVAPGEYLGADGYLRLTHGLPRERVAPALDRIAEVTRGLRR